jgi:hypothetical protein
VEAVPASTARLRPDGQISDALCALPVRLSSPFRKNILIFRNSKSVYIHARLVPQRGGSRSSRTRGGMRWTLIAPLTNGAEADGEVVWS